MKRNKAEGDKSPSEPSPRPQALARIPGSPKTASLGQSKPDARRYVVAVAGATGAVGEEMVKILEERKFPIEELRLFASERSASSSAIFQERDLKIAKMAADSFAGVNLALFATDASISREFAPKAVAAGAVVIDNSSAYRMDEGVPLVVPEVNGDVLARHSARHSGIIANPNCSTAQLVVALKPLHDAARLKRVIVTTFQSVSGTGREAMNELLDQTRAILAFREPKRRVYSEQIAFNCIVDWPTDGATGYNEEEMKIIRETRKILGIADLAVTATTVRVPVFRAHAESVTIQTEKPLAPNEARALLSGAPGIIVFDDPVRRIYPTPLDVAGKDEVFIGRIRTDESAPNSLHLWVVADNLRKGAALNAVQIAERLISSHG